MSKASKIWLIIAASLMVVGLVLFAATASAISRNFTGLNGADYETRTYVIEESFRDIHIDTDTADIVFVPTKDSHCSVVCYETDNEKHSVEVREGVLIIHATHQFTHQDLFRFSFDSPRITVYLPDSAYAELTIRESTGDIEIPKDFTFETIDLSVSTGDMKIFASALGAMQLKASTGDIQTSGVSAEKLELTVSTGKITASDITCQGDIAVLTSTGKASLTGVSCKNLVSDGSTGDLSLKNVIAAEAIRITRSTGDVSFDRCDAVDIFVETGTGDVTGTLLSEKVFLIDTSTGDVRIPFTTMGGTCQVTTSTGDIEIDIY